MQRQKIVLIKGIHQNELDLSKEIARDLSRRGHRVRIVEIPFRETMHGHSKHGKKKRSFADFEGAAFLARVGFRFPSWHVIGLHSSPRENLQGILLIPHEVLHGRGAFQRFFAPGHLYWQFGATDFHPAFPERGRLYFGSLLRTSLEIPAVYQAEHSMPLDLSKFTVPGKRKVEVIKTAYERSVNRQKTFAWAPRQRLVSAAVERIEKSMEAALSLHHSYLAREGFYPVRLSREAEVARFYISRKSPKYRDAPVGYRKALQLAARFAKKQQG